MKDETDLARLHAEMLLGAAAGRHGWITTKRCASWRTWAWTA